MPAFSSTDNAVTTLAAAITTTTQTPITISSATGFPGSGNYVVEIDSEQMLVTSGQGSTSWGVTRAYAGTVAATHLNSAPVTLIWSTNTLQSWGGGDGSVAPGYWSTLSPKGLTGATAATRWVGATNSGAPVAGTFAVGDFVVDQTGLLWVCTVAGSPGTWLLILPPSGNGRINTSETTTSTSYADLATPGPAVTLITGTTVAISIGGFLTINVASERCSMALAISGSTTLAANDVNAMSFQPFVANAGQQQGHTLPITGLTAGSNTFTVKYKTTAGTASFANRSLIVTRLN
jgi:hypothetical protein